jgi:uncharacterized membrane protein YoaK (UPF0700 family)
MAVTSPVADRFTVAALLLLTLATGLADSMSILVLGHVFVANMTGNSGRLLRLFGERARPWIATVLATEIALLAALSILAGAGVLRYHDNSKLIMIGVLAVTFGLQHSSARQFGIQELSTTVLTSTIVSLGLDSRLAGGTGKREKLRLSVVFTMCAGALVGATMSRFVVAPVFAVTAVVVALSLAIFLFGPANGESPAGEAN